MPKYKTTGTLTGTIESENVGAAQGYLQQDDMTQFVDEPLKSVVEHVQWFLSVDGHGYEVLVITNRLLTDEESRKMSSWISGQNSDGLGEGFEQQEFAEMDCGGECYACSGPYYMGDACEATSMISFDWQDNDSALVLQQ